MTTAPDVLAEAARRGVVLSVEGDRLTWRAPAGAVTPDLMESMRTHKTAILAALREPDVIARQRWGRPPDVEIPLSLLKPILSDRDTELVTEHTARQPAEVVRWVCQQANRYDVSASHWQPPAVRELAAMLDCLLWQWEQVLTPPARASRYDRVQEAVRKVRDLEEAARYFTEHQPAPAGEKERPSP